jgi:hypothetical protein
MHRKRTDRKVKFRVFVVEMGGSGKCHRGKENNE